MIAPIDPHNLPIRYDFKITNLLLDDEIYELWNMRTLNGRSFYKMNKFTDVDEMPGIHVIVL